MPKGMGYKDEKKAMKAGKPTDKVKDKVKEKAMGAKNEVAKKKKQQHLINPHQYINLILEPALRATGTYSLDAMYLLVCTAMVESKLSHIKQLPDGPAVGFMQIEPITFIDIKRYLSRKDELRSKILIYCERPYLPDNPMTLASDLTLNVLMARVKYWMHPEPIPSYKNPEAQAEYYEKYYNANKEVNKVEEFIKHSQAIVGWINHGEEIQ